MSGQKMSLREFAHAEVDALAREAAKAGAISDERAGEYIMQRLSEPSFRALSSKKSVGDMLDQALTWAQQERPDLYDEVRRAVEAKDIAEARRLIVQKILPRWPRTTPTPDNPSCRAEGGAR